MRHLYECPMRWADLDLLGHINNVVYVDYLQEARVDMFRVNAPDSRADDLAEGVVVVRHEVTYVSPLTFRFRPVTIECWVTEIRAASFTMAYEIVDGTGEDRVIHLRATTVLTPYVFGTERPRRITPEEREVLERFLTPAPRVRPGRAVALDHDGAVHYPVHVRFSDVDVYGHVNNVKYLEFFQESRISLLASLTADVPDGRETRIVVAQTDVDYKIPILFRPEPYDCWSRITRVGTTSMTIESEITDDERVLSRARVVAVWFDPVTQRPAEPSPALRSVLEKAVLEGAVLEGAVLEGTVLEPGVAT
ncbi:MAG: thioesterase family protein [Nocardioides sp.]